jgi:hypothetical protein
VRRARALVNTRFAMDRAADELEALLRRVAEQGSTEREARSTKRDAG